MDKYFKTFQDILNEGDPTVREWFLVKSNYSPIVISGLYVLFTTVLGPSLMRKRKPFDLRIPMIVLNFFLVTVYAVCLLIFIWNIQHTDFHLWCVGTFIRKGHVKYTFAELSWVLYITKYVELLDTVFFVLRKRQNQVSFLHVLHHAAIPVLFWLSLRTETAGFQLIPLNVNGFIHIVMYSYYGLAAMGPSVKKHLWWKKYITQLQIIQFIMVILLMVFVVPVTGCKMKPVSYFTNLFFVPLFLYLFFQFYMDKYKTRKMSKDLAKANLKKFESGKRYLNGIAEEKID